MIFLFIWPFVTSTDIQIISNDDIDINQFDVNQVISDSTLDTNQPALNSFLRKNLTFSGIIDFNGDVETDDLNVDLNLAILGRTTITAPESSSSTSIGGAVNITNTSNTGSAVTIYSNIGSTANGRLLVIRADNSAFDQAAAHITYDGTANALEVLHDGNDSSALAFNVVSNNESDSVFGINGRTVTKGVGKIVHLAVPNDSGASVLSLAIDGNNTAAQGLFIDSNQGTTGNLMTIRNNDGLEYFTIRGNQSNGRTGYVGIGRPSPTTKLDVNGDVNGTRLCIAGDCRSTWPAGGADNNDDIYEVIRLVIENEGTFSSDECDPIDSDPECGWQDENVSNSLTVFWDGLDDFPAGCDEDPDAFITINGCTYGGDLDNTWNGINTFSDRLIVSNSDDFQTVDANITDDLNVSDLVRIGNDLIVQDDITTSTGDLFWDNTVSMIFDLNFIGGAATGNELVRMGSDLMIATQGSGSATFTMISTGVAGIISYSGLVFTVNDDWLPTQTNVFDLGSATARWNDVFVVNHICGTSCVYSVSTGGDNNHTMTNNSAGKANLNIPDGNAYFSGPGNVYIQGNLNLDKNIVVRDENNGWILNSIIMIGDANAGTSGTTLATNTGNTLGVTLTCLRAILIDGAITNCSDIGGTRNIWAKVN